MGCPSKPYVEQFDYDGVVPHGVTDGVYHYFCDEQCKIDFRELLSTDIIRFDRRANNYIWECKGCMGETCYASGKPTCLQIYGGVTKYFCDEPCREAYEKENNVQA